MNHPTGFTLVGRRGRRRRTRSRRCSATATSGTSSSTCTSPATSSPASCVAGVYAVGRAARPLGPLRADRAADPADGRRARRAGADRRRRLGRARGRRGAADQARRVRGPRRDRRAARRCTSLGWYDDGEVQLRHRDPEAAVAARLPRPERDGAGPRRRAGQTTGRRSTSSASRSRPWSASARCSRARRRATPDRAGSGGGGCPSRRGSTARSWSPGPLSVVALIAGWVTTEVGRQPWVVYGVMRTEEAVTGRRRHPDRLRDARRSSTPACWSRSSWILRRLARAPLELPRRAPASGAMSLR